VSRGRPAKLIPSERLGLYLPVDMKARIDLHLFSEVEGRVPSGAYSKFFEGLVREFFQSLDRGLKQRKYEYPLLVQEHNPDAIPALRLTPEELFNFAYPPGDQRRYTSQGWAKIKLLAEKGLFDHKLREIA
jgi:hypothetical protein